MPDPVSEFAARLRQLRDDAGSPSPARLAELTRDSVWPLRRNTIYDKLQGKSVASWEFVTAFVTACAAHARSIGSPLPDDRVDLDAWDSAHTRMLDAVAGSRTEVRHAKAARTERARRDTAASPTPTRPVADWDPFHLGVHRAIDVERPADAHPLPLLPGYAMRAHDREVDQLLNTPKQPTMLVLVGTSSTGKTRAAYQALIRSQPGWPLLRPTDTADLVNLLTAGAVPVPSVLWLDETQRFLDGSAGPAAAAGLRRLLASDTGPVVVVGTMWPQHWAALTTRPPQHESPTGTIEMVPDPHWQARELLLHTVRRIDVPETFTEASDPHEPLDPRLATAVAAAGASGKAIQVLAGGLALIERYERPGSPVGRHAQALLTAAMDARRLGHRRPMRRSFLADAAPGYLDAEQRADTSRGWFDSALAHASADIHGVRALAARRDRPGVGEPDGYELAEYLDQHARTVRSGTVVPAATWDCLIRHATHPDDRVRLASAARQRRLYRCAAALLAPAVDAGNTRAMHMLAGLMKQIGHDQHVEPLLRRAVLAGDDEAALSLARWLIRAGRDDEAEQPLRDAAEAGNSEAIAGLVARLENTGRSAEAQPLLVKLNHAAEERDPTALLWWCSWLKGKHRDQEFRTWLVVAANSGLSQALVDIRGRGPDWHDPQLERALWRFIDDGSSIAVRLLAELLRRNGRDHDVEPMLWRAAQAGSHAAIDMLGESVDDDRLRRAAQAGNAEAMLAHAQRLAEHGHDRDADEWLLRAARVDGGIDVHCWTPGWEPGDLPHEAGPQYMKRLIYKIGGRHCVHITCEGAHGWRKAQQFLLSLVEAGSRDAIREFARLMQNARRVDELESLLRHLTEVGRGHEAEWQLQLLLYDTGRHDEAARLARFGIEPGGFTADPW